MPIANYNPTNASSLSGVIEEVLRNFSLSLENCIPAVVESYNRATNTVVVRPAINSILTDGTIKPRDTIELPVHILGGNGLVVSMPLSAGNTGWIIAGDRDIALFKQSLSVANPNTYRTHKFAFGFFIPDKISGVTIQAGDENALTIQTLDGTTRIAITDGHIKVVSSVDLTVESPSVSITGTTSIVGDLTVTGTITGQTDVIAVTVSGKGHQHTGGTQPDGKTGVPVQ